MDQVLFSPRFSWFLGFDSKTVQRSALCRFRRELSNESYLRNLASIQPRTSSPKFAEASKRYPPPLINLALRTLVGIPCDFGDRLSYPKLMSCSPILSRQLLKNGWSSLSGWAVNFKAGLLLPLWSGVWPVLFWPCRSLAARIAGDQPWSKKPQRLRKVDFTQIPVPS